MFSILESRSPGAEKGQTFILKSLLKIFFTEQALDSKLKHEVPPSNRLRGIQVGMQVGNLVFKKRQAAITLVGRFGVYPGG